jgi:hypothetical protein
MIGYQDYCIGFLIQRTLRELDLDLTPVILETFKHHPGFEWKTIHYGGFTQHYIRDIDNFYSPLEKISVYKHFRFYIDE